MICLLILLKRAKFRVNGNKGGRQNAFAEEVIQEIRDAYGGAKRVSNNRIDTKIVPDDPLANKTCETADENSQRYAGRSSQSGSRARWRSGRAYVRSRTRNANADLQMTGLLL